MSAICEASQRIPGRKPGSSVTPKLPNKVGRKIYIYVYIKNMEIIYNVVWNVLHNQKHPVVEGQVSKISHPDVNMHGQQQRTLPLGSPGRAGTRHFED